MTKTFLLPVMLTASFAFSGCEILWKTNEEQKTGFISQTVPNPSPTPDFALPSTAIATAHNAQPPVQVITVEQPKPKQIDPPRPPPPPPSPPVHDH